ncbi:MAG: hypothetical protein JEZ03_05405 [Bacteroidales bacterium]|nr:hypothetical protein [Bacteroidales bacterium]
MRRKEIISTYGLEDAFTKLLLFILIIGATNSANAQRIKGIRTGVNIIPIVSSCLDSIQYSYELSMDYEIYKNIYAVVEGGYQSVSINKPEYTYNSKGSFFRMGADLNKLKTAINEYHMGYIGMRYAFTNFSQEFPRYTLPANYWEQGMGSLPKTFSTFHWAEVVAGIRGELLKNLYMGWSVRIRIPISKIENFENMPYSIPGYGNPNSSPVLDINYSIYYKIPLIRSKTKKSI